MLLEKFLLHSIFIVTEKRESASVLVRVNFSPFISKMEVDLIKSNEGGFNLEVTCSITGWPEPKVAWYRNGDAISLSEERVRLEQAGSRRIRPARHGLPSQ